MSMQSTQNLTSLFAHIENDNQEAEEQFGQGLDAEIQEELKEAKLNYDSIAKEVSKAAKESLSSKTLRQYEK
jgi:hypothetical protein